MTQLSQVLDVVRNVPAQRLVEVLGEIHRKERPNPLSLIEPELDPRQTDVGSTPQASAESPLAQTIPVAPASPTAQAHEDLVEHERLLSDYGERVQKFLEHLGPTDAGPLPELTTAQLVPLRSDEHGACGTFMIHNPGSLAAEASFLVRAPASGVRGGPGEMAQLQFEPASLVLEPGESRRVSITRGAAELDLGFARDVEVRLDGEPALALRVEMLVDSLDSAPAGDSDLERAGPQLILRRPDDQLAKILREAQLLLLRHPLAAQAVFRSFVAEGRRFGQTEDGRRLGEELADSELVRRGRVLWEVGTLKLLEEQAPTMLPSKLLDAFVQAAAADDLEGSMLRLFGYGASDGHPADPAQD